MGLAADANGLWISERGNRRLLHFLPEKNKVARGSGSCSEFTFAFLPVPHHDPFRRGRPLISASLHEFTGKAVVEELNEAEWSPIRTERTLGGH